MEQQHPPAAIPPGSLGAWWREGVRSALLRDPRWEGLHTTPAVVISLLLTSLLIDLVAQRLYIDGEARFYAPALQSGWLSTVIGALACWLLVPQADPARAAPRAPSASALFAMLLAQSLTLWIVIALASVALVRAGWWSPQVLGQWGSWIAWALPLLWVAAAQLRLAWRGGSASGRARAGAAGLLVGVLLLSQWLQPLRFWYPDESADRSAGREPFQLTQELFERQAPLLDAQLRQLAAPRRGQVDVFSITFAPYAEEDVFLRESRLVSGVMETRFGAAGRSLQLVNHRDTAQALPWATPANLQRAIAGVAERMDPDEDLLFIHLTSHGARSGALAAGFWPLSVAPVTPELLHAWLEEAGVRHRIVSVSACYSGSWIAPLRDEHTLVMTAADAEHTSYGCGSRSELTFFGRAMFDEELRHTWSFEKAHAQARTVIEQREKDAGKDDGYSNPLIHVGASIRPQLERLERERAAATP
ncbi:MAG: C13 family peptidase [Piscinibacter sp.]